MTLTSGQLLSSASLNAILPSLLSGSWTQTSFDATTCTSNVATGVYGNPSTGTTGPSVTVTSTGTRAFVFISSFITASAAHNAQASVAVSGATTLSAATNSSGGLLILNANSLQIISASLDILTINAGTNVYTMQYTNSGTQTGTFVDRQLIVIAP